MRGQVAEDTTAAAHPLVAPGQRTLRMGRVVAEETDAHMGHVPDAAGDDQLAGRHDRGGAPVVEADRAPDPGLGHRARHRPGVVGGQTHRLLDPDVLAGLGHGHTDLTVQEVRRGDAHGLHARIGGDLPPVTYGVGEAVPRGGLLGAAGYLVGDGDRFGTQGEPREVVEYAGVRLRVHPSHPAEPHDSDTERTHHDRPPRPIPYRNHRAPDSSRTEPGPSVPIQTYPRPLGPTHTERDRTSLNHAESDRPERDQTGPVRPAIRPVR